MMNLGVSTPLEAPVQVLPEVKPKSHPHANLKLSKAVKVFIEEKAEEKQVRASTKGQNTMPLISL